MMRKRALVASIAKVKGVVLKVFLGAMLSRPFLFGIVENEGRGIAPYNLLRLCI